MTATDNKQEPAVFQHAATNKERSLEDGRLAAFPSLAALGITEDDLEELSQQGFVCEERRGARRFYKLRFRRQRKQIVRYVGDARRAATVASELAALQHETRLMRKLRAGVKVTSGMLRDAKRQLEPLLQAHGFTFHGLAIRKPRKRSS